MNTTMTGAHSPPSGLCEACAFDFHDRCTGRALMPAPVKPCGCLCERATATRLTAAAIGDYAADWSRRQSQSTRPAMAPPVSFTRDERAEPSPRARRDASPPDPRDGSPPPWADRLAYTYYAIAATGAAVGQAWGALTLIPWPAGWPVWLRVALVLLPAVCLETFGMASAAMADVRQRLGERAYGFRALSAAAASAAVGLIVAGHRTHPHLMLIFVTLSVSAYALWLLHSAARRRDALRAARKLADTAPAYGLYRRVRHPIITRQAAELAREHGYDLYASLRAAELAIRAEKRRPAIAAAVGELVRAEHRDPRMAQIAVTTLDLDRIAAGLTDRADYDQWADRLAPAVMANRPDPTPGTVPHKATRNGSGSSGRKQPGTVHPEPGSPNMADRIKALAEQEPELSRAELARRLNVTDRYVREVLNGPARTDNP